MTIVKAASAPLFVVLGSSGNQGGSVVRALAASSRPYRVRAIMRDTSKPIAKELEASGVETRAADVLTSEGLKHAFQDADLAFGHTASEYGAMNAADVVRPVPASLEVVQVLMLFTSRSSPRPSPRSTRSRRLEPRSSSGPARVISRRRLALMSTCAFCSSSFQQSSSLTLLLQLHGQSPRDAVRPLGRPQSPRRPSPGFRDQLHHPLRPAQTGRRHLRPRCTVQSRHSDPARGHRGRLWEVRRRGARARPRHRLCDA